jgi:hypothetical protein
MVISRIGSIIIEPLYKKFKIVTFVEYKYFIKACETDPKIDILSETNNTYRTFIALFFLIGVMKIYIYLSSKSQLLNSIAPIISLLILLLLFSIAYKKQVNYIKNRVEHICQNHNQGVS